MKVLARHDLLIETVQAHLRSLASMSVYNADQPTARIATAALRALISEEMLQRAWGASGLRGPMTFKTYFIASTSGDDVIAYCGGGDILPNDAEKAAKRHVCEVHAGRRRVARLTLERTLIGWNV